MAKETVLKMCLCSKHTAFILAVWLLQETLLELVEIREVYSTP